MATHESSKAPDWFTIRDAAAYLNVGEPTIYRWMREGKITYRKVGDSTRFLQEDLDSVVEIHPSTKDAETATEFCPACHGTDLVDGDIRSTGRVSFHPAASRFWTFQDSTIATKARMCTRCGLVTLRGDTNKLTALIPKQDAETTGGKETPKED